MAMLTTAVLKKFQNIGAYIYNVQVHGSSEPFWIWVEDPENNHIYHSEYFILHKKQVV